MPFRRTTIYECSRCDHREEGLGGDAPPLNWLHLTAINDSSPLHDTDDRKYGVVLCDDCTADFNTFLTGA